MSLKNTLIYILKKIIKLCSLIVVLSLVTFILLEKSPINPVNSYTENNLNISAEQIANINDYWGLDKEPMERFIEWGKNALQGDLGISMIYRKDVTEVITEKFIASLALMLIAWIISGLLGFVMGIISGVNENKLLDKIIRTYCYVLLSTPTFWLGMLFIIVFSVQLDLFPIALGVPIGVESTNVSLMDKLQHLVLPTMTLSVIGVANIALHTREKVIEIMSSDYILYAKARGESKKEIIKNHVVRNVSLPAITLQFLSFSELFAGTVFAEQVFSYPGLGQATVDAGIKGDFNLLMGIVIVSVIFIFIGNLIADILHQIIDPRMRGDINYDEKCNTL